MIAALAPLTLFALLSPPTSQPADADAERELSISIGRCLPLVQVKDDPDLRVRSIIPRDGKSPLFKSPRYTNNCFYPALYVSSGSVGFRIDVIHISGARFYPTHLQVHAGPKIKIIKRGDPGFITTTEAFENFWATMIGARPSRDTLTMILNAKSLNVTIANDHDYTFFGLDEGAAEATRRMVRLYFDLERAARAGVDLYEAFRPEKLKASRELAVAEDREDARRTIRKNLRFTATPTESPGFTHRITVSNLSEFTLTELRFTVRAGDATFTTTIPELRDGETKSKRIRLPAASPPEFTVESFGFNRI